MALGEKGFHVNRAILFGSYASGTPHNYSDIDLAIWLGNYPQSHYTDIPSLVRVVASYNPIRPKFYSNEETAETDVFIQMIEKTGKEIMLLRNKQETEIAHLTE